VVFDAADRSFFMGVYMAAKRLGVNAQTPGVAPPVAAVRLFKKTTKNPYVDCP
jgi:hypothetical protein